MSTRSRGIYLLTAQSIQSGSLCIVIRHEPASAQAAMRVDPERMLLD
jgi:hypothetical protein